MYIHFFKYLKKILYNHIQKLLFFKSTHFPYILLYKVPLIIIMFSRMNCSLLFCTLIYLLLDTNFSIVSGQNLHNIMSHVIYLCHYYHIKCAAIAYHQHHD